MIESEDGDIGRQLREKDERGENDVAGAGGETSTAQKKNEVKKDGERPKFPAPPPDEQRKPRTLEIMEREAEMLGRLMEEEDRRLGRL